MKSIPKTAHTQQVQGPIQTHKPSCSASWSNSADWTICLKKIPERRCLKKLEIIFFSTYTRTVVGIWQQDTRISALGDSLRSPPALSKLLEQIQPAFQHPPPLAEGYLSPDNHKAHHTNISPPAMPLSFCSAVTSVMVLFLWENEALPPLICLHLSSNLSAAHIPSQNMTA